MILVNVLTMVAVAAALVLAMLDREVPAIDRTASYREAAQALAIARGGELSTVAALRRDNGATPGGATPDGATPDGAVPGDATPDGLTAHDATPDNAINIWAKVAQAPTPIAGGSFALAIGDAQGRFNVNAATGAGEPLLAAIVAALGLPADVAGRIAATIATRGRVRDVGELARAGLDEATLARLGAMVTALPGAAPINLNAAPPALLDALFGGAAGRQLALRRDRTGRLTALDLAAAGVEPPPGVGFTSDHFIVTATVTQGGTTLTLTSLLERRREGGHAPAVIIISRRLGSG